MTADSPRGWMLDDPFDAVSLDVGGVLVLPDQGILAHLLERHDIPFDRGRFTEGHYRAMAEFDRCRAEPETFTDYQRGFLRAIDVPDEYLEVGAAALREILSIPLWCQRLPGSLAAARRLGAAGVPLVLTSNADGTIEDVLGRHEIAQVGPGPGLEVVAITDSGILGRHKPDPAMFLASAAALGLPPERILHIGDSGRLDADGAINAGMVGVHLDPLGWCEDKGHHHREALAELADLVDGGGAR